MQNGVGHSAVSETKILNSDPYIASQLLGNRLGYSTGVRVFIPNTHIASLLLIVHNHSMVPILTTRFIAHLRQMSLKDPHQASIYDAVDVLPSPRLSWATSGSSIVFTDGPVPQWSSGP